MKNTLFVLILLSTINGYSQDFKVKSGVNIPDFENKHIYEERAVDVLGSNTIGFYIGVNYEYSLNENFSLDADLLYSSLSNTGNSNFPGKSKFQSIQVPLTFNYCVFDKLKLGLGTSLNYHIKSEHVYKSEIDHTLPHNDFLNQKFEFYDNTSYSLHIGTSYNIWNDFFIDVRYNFGLGNIYDSETESVANSKYNNLQLGLSYKF